MSEHSAVLVRGLVVGFAIAAPVGPIGVLCIRRTLTDGGWSGFVFGMGAATADALYGAVAGFGLTCISTFLVGQQIWLRLAGGVFLCLLGARSFMSRPPAHGAATSSSALGAWASTFALTLTNPMTILSFAAVFAGPGVAGAGGRYDLAGVLHFVLPAGQARGPAGS